MIDMQSRVRWLVAFGLLIVFLVIPIVAGSAFTEAGARKFAVVDLRNWNVGKNGRVLVADAANTIFLVPPAGTRQCDADGRDCPSLEERVIGVPMSRTADARDVLEKAYDGLTVGDDGTATRIRETFGWKAAVLTGGLLVVGALVSIAVLSGRQPARPEPAGDHARPADDKRPAGKPPAGQAPRPPVVPYDAVAQAQPPPTRTPPTVELADLPGIRDLVREHGALATARSHFDDGGYVVLGDVLAWATPRTPAAIVPGDDVHVTVVGDDRRTPPHLDGGQLP
jgi:hypothetical protein